MKTILLSALSVLAAVLLEPSTSLAESEQFMFTSRSARVGLSYNYQTAHDFDSSQSGLGFVGVYEFNLNPRFALGIDLEYRFFRGDDSVRQLGYGLMLKHYLPDMAGMRPYLEYGLLMNVTRVSDRDKAGTSHDTRLAVGADFMALNKPFFVDMAYHYSRLSYFDQPTLNLDYVQLSVGTRFNWGTPL